jgi:hypothetical protein
MLITGQAAVQFAYAKTAAGPCGCAIKCFSKRSEYDMEVNIYKRCGPELQRLMPKVIQFQPNEDGSICDPFGTPMPPYIVLERGESLREFSRKRQVNTISTAKLLL